eukprot:comp19990_c0_seq1/m.24444 comp19990_c0_seq1/g.24444  ORF comp19990_c0_seq1/g.24444 comp19990_c0_seq1/m.24444 type:complete len:397 (-) comp19990_c0_seq1:363-1553(-)
MAAKNDPTPSRFFNFVLSCTYVAFTAAVVLLDIFQPGEQPTTEKPVILDSVLGWVAVAGSIHCFGAYGVYMKALSVRCPHYDFVIFQLFLSFGTAFMCALVALYKPVYFSLWGIAGAALWVATQIMAMIAVKHTGYAMSPAVWGGVTIIVSFLWGVIAFHQHPKSLIGSVLGIAVLTAGVILVAVCKDARVVGAVRACVGMNASEREEEEKAPLLSGPPSTIEPQAETDVIAEQGTSIAIGLGTAASMGLINGSLMVPYYYYAHTAHPEATAAGDVSLGYLVSFAAGAALVTPILAACYVLYHRNIDCMAAARMTAGPGFVTGMYWACGFLCATYATKYLGNTIGYPLTQVAILANTLWGVVYFREIKGRATLVLLTMGAFCVLGGAAILSLFGSS